MEQTYDIFINDPQLNTHLCKNDTVVFRKLGRAWREIERQVERLGFDDAYMTSYVSAKRGEICRLVPFGSANPQRYHREQDHESA